jgi:hypothetical protein
LQAGGRRFESDHLHHFGDGEGRACIAEKRQEIGIGDSALETLMPEVSPVGGAGLDLCHGESGSGASLGAPIAGLGSNPRLKSDRCFGTRQWGGVQRRLLCAERE